MQQAERRLRLGTSRRRRGLSLRHPSGRTAGSGRDGDRRHAAGGNRHSFAEKRAARAARTGRRRWMAVLPRAESDVAILRERAAGLETQVAALKEEIDVLAEQAADLRSRITQHRERRAGLHEEVVAESQRNERHSARNRQPGCQPGRTPRVGPRRRNRRSKHCKRGWNRPTARIREKEQHRQHRQHECMAAEVALAKVEERFAALRARHRQVENDLTQRLQERQQGERHLAEARARQQESQRIMLQASATLAVCYLEKEAAEREVALAHRRTRPATARTATPRRTIADCPGRLAPTAGTGPRQRTASQRFPAPPRQPGRPAPRRLSAGAGGPLSASDGERKPVRPMDRPAIPPCIPPMPSSRSPTCAASSIGSAASTSTRFKSWPTWKPARPRCRRNSTI